MAARRLCCAMSAARIPSLRKFPLAPNLCTSEKYKGLFCGNLSRNNFATLQAAEEGGQEFSQKWGDRKVEELSEDELQELREDSKDLIFSLLEEKGPMRKPAIWKEVKDTLLFSNRTRFNHFLWSLHRKKIIRARPSSNLRRYEYSAQYKDKWTLAEESLEEVQLKEPTWHTLLGGEATSEEESKSVWSWIRGN
mmetsp:Transcript_27766/g.38416  ORF Transcript_27766/g.38416 Transcript_27766/m.38416 type:complete len:194 (-) Transcript_27766:121-702(-)|eukprot:jgi/Bigna1/85300/estExt_fgenesh1_pg.C_30182